MKKILLLLKAYFSNDYRIVITKVKGELPLESLITDIKAGETAYVYPWAFNKNTQQLNLGFPITEEPSGTSCMPVTKTKDGVLEVETDFDYFGEKYAF